MAISVVMPALEIAQETGKLLSWLKKEGDTVAKGEPLLEIETDKAVMEIESPGEGILAGIRVEPGTDVPVGQTIAWIVNPGEAPPIDDPPVAPGGNATPSPAVTSAPAIEPTASTPKGLRVSPKARRLAAERNLDLGRVPGTGPAGEILASDILSFLNSRGETEGTGESQISRLMAERTTRSWTRVPHFFVVREVDAGALVELRARLAPAIEDSRHVKLTHTDLLIALVARALLKHPRFNATWNGEKIHMNKEVNIGLAIAVSEGVVAPVIHHAERADLGEIAVRRRDLAERSRCSKLRLADLAGATFTISNLGMYEVDAFSAIINPPQVAILAVGRITERVMAVGGEPLIRPVMTLTLSADHRVADGARAAQFLADLATMVNNPAPPLS